MVKAFRDNLLPPLRSLHSLIAEKVLPQFTIWMNFVVSTVIPKVKEAARVIQSIFGKAMQFIGWVITTLVIPAIDALSNWWQNNKKEIEPLLPVLAQVVKWFLIIAAVVTGVLIAVFVGPLVAAVLAVIAVFAALTAAVVYVIKGAKWLWKEVVMVAGAIRDFFVAAWQAIVSALTTAWDAIVSVVMAGLGVLRGAWEGFWSVFGGLFKAVWDLIVAIARLGMTAVVFVFQWGAKMVTDVWNALWPPLHAGIMVVWNGIVTFLKAAWSGISNFASSTFNNIKNIVIGAWNATKSNAISVWNAVYSAIEGPVTRARELVMGTFDKIRGFFSGARDWLVQAGRNIIQGLVDGITSMIQKVTDAINAVTRTIRDHLPHSPAKVGPLSGKGDPYYSGKAIGRLLSAGMVDNMDTVQKASSMLAQSASIDGYATAGNLSANGSAVNKNYYVTQNITTQEIDPRVHSAQLGWELQAVM
jgi:phage-related protein